MEGHRDLVLGEIDTCTVGDEQLRLSRWQTSGIYLPHRYLSRIQLNSAARSPFSAASLPRSNI